MRHVPGLFLLLAACASAASTASVHDGAPAPALSGATLSGETMDLAALRGQVVLVDFWASWCAPCKASFPALAKIHTDLSPKGLMVAAVSIDEKPAAAVAFAKKLAPPFLTLHDREQKLVKQVVVPTMPTTYLVDRTGKVRFMHEGYHGDATDKQLRQEIETLLAEKN